MTEELLRCKTEQEIRTRFRYAPTYYLQAKLEKRRALGGPDKQAAADTEPGTQAVPAEQPIEQATPPEPESLDVMALAPKRAKATTLAPESPEDAIPEFEILNVAAPDPGLTQQTILATALEGYSNWPFLPDTGLAGAPALIEAGEGAGVQLFHGLPVAQIVHCPVPGKAAPVFIGQGGVHGFETDEAKLRNRKQTADGGDGHVLLMGVEQQVAAIAQGIEVAEIQNPS